jgi:hypothetical protein
VNVPTLALPSSRRKRYKNKVFMSLLGAISVGLNVEPVVIIFLVHLNVLDE